MTATNFKDLTGQKFNRWTVDNFSHTNKYNEACWNCTCICGNKRSITGSSLRKGTSKSCGCFCKEMTILANKLDLTGKKFGKLTAIKDMGRTKWGDTKWLCKCDCGNESIATSTHLQSGHTKSCGCLHKEKTTRIDLTGEKYGKLAVISYSHTKNKRAYWNCKCNCGNDIIVHSGCLESGNTKSCGCEVSRGNNKIAEILTILNIRFEKEKRFADCKNKMPLPFDFYLPDYNTLIEYQGRQHYKRGNWSKNKEKNEKNFNGIQKHDQIKRDYCKQNNIELLEINYKHFDKIPNILDKLSDSF